MLRRESEYDLRLVWRLGTPISQALTLAANLSEQIDSPTDEGSGDTFTNINVFESPPKQGCNKLLLLLENPFKLNGFYCWDAKQFVSNDT